MQLKDSKGVSRNDITVTARDGHKIAVRVYQPDPSPGSAPLVIFLHGGGFVLGGLENEELLCTLFAQRLKVVVLNVDYRLAPENPFPAAPNDAWDVVKWAAGNASQVGADPSKGFVVGGVSAGGNLAAVCAHLARDEKLSPPITGSMLQIPMVLQLDSIEEKYRPEINSYEQNKDAPVLSQKSIDLFEGLYKADHKSHLQNLFAPPTNFSGLPPTYFQICGMDPLRDEGLLYERLLREEYGTKTKLDVYGGLPHGFWSFAPEMSKSKKAIEDAVEGIKWLLG
ncbi:hypothetical protein NA57DRAFT_63239 [Rhizodiscina lignyota]|uniref:Alpha/beta hydrolase fold-3 domain-containing protein n=1 Tax=Rhizodiscina lignyota TaxID=1504668 RepID=A0A9P4IVH3_9PEZI|nr:hypothetical protein NA57DRAFT_63239 [Rhizodiscina lignyota]